MSDAFEALVLRKLAGAFLPGKNLFDLSKVSMNAHMGDGGFLIEGSDQYHVSDFIPVEPGQTYTGRGVNGGMRCWAAFDAAKNVIPSQGSDDPGQHITAAPGVAFYRVTLNQSDLSSFQFEIGDQATPYEAYGPRLKRGFQSGLVPETGRPSWHGLNCTILGDSVTKQGVYVDRVSQVLGLNITQSGVGGRRASGVGGLHEDAAIAEVATDQHLVITAIGTNDFFQSRDLGEPGLANRDTETFTGALNVICEKQLVRHPRAIRVLMTQTYSRRGDPLPETGWGPDGETNGRGLKARDYAKRMREVAYDWSLPVIDQYGWAMWSGYNVQSYMKDEQNDVHPDDRDDIEGDQFNDRGSDRMASLIIGTLMQIAPIRW